MTDNRGVVDRDGGFEALYAAHYDDLYRFALRRVTEPADAADVIAETWVVAWRRRAELPPGAEQRLWLFGVARRVLANHRRGELRRSRLADRLRDEVARTAPTVDPDTPVLRGLARLSPADRDLLAMQAWEELTAGEIAVVLGCSSATVRVRLHRARARLRSVLRVEITPSPLRGTTPTCPSKGTP